MIHFYTGMTKINYENNTPEQIINAQGCCFLNYFKNLSFNYFEIINAETLEPVSAFSQVKGVVACIAVTLGTVRLIDNIVLRP